VQLSILFPTHRHDLTTLSRIAQACSWASPSIEVIVRDNSGNTEKRSQIAQFKRDHCTIVSVDPCEPLENFSGLMRLAKGDFVFCVADDDLFFNRAIAALPPMIDRFGRDPSVAAISGPYLVENSKGVAVVSYPNIDSDDVTARVAGFANYPGVNSLFYSVQRRAMVESVFGFMGAMPVYLSYHDQIACLLYLLHGKYLKLPRLFYGYDIGDWENLQSAQKRDLAFYSAAGLDPAINKLHWFLCAFEGAILIRNCRIFPDHPMAQRQQMADVWFSSMFKRFLVNPRFIFDSKFGAEADALCDRLRASQGRLSFVDMLSDICHFIALFSDEKAQGYLSFWAELLRPRKAVVNA
jgi:hypothetical protein